MSFWCSGRAGDHPFRPVRQVHRQPIPRLDAEARQRLGKRHRFPFDLRVTHPARPEYQKLTVRMLPRRLREEQGQMICRHVYHVPHSGVNL